MTLSSFAQSVLARVLGARLVRISDLRIERDKVDKFNFLVAFRDFDVHKLLESLPYSRSQLKQDLFVLAALDFKQNGFFVEFGASDGVTLSNSFLLEKNFGWSGILAEPLPLHSRSLRDNRSASLDFRCVFDRSDWKVEFIETLDSDLSTIKDF